MQGKTAWAGIQETYSLNRHLPRRCCGPLKEFLRTEEAGSPLGTAPTGPGAGQGVRQFLSKCLLNQIGLPLTPKAVSLFRAAMTLLIQNKKTKGLKL